MKKISGLLIILTVLLIFSNVTNASFRGYSLEEMKKESDIIIIGKVKGPVGEDLQYTIWNVDVIHYIKGEPEESNVKVRTFGTTQFHTSADYDLGPKNGYVLLFLKRKPDSIYITMSITGVVNLTRNINGSFVIKSPWSNQEIQKYIDQNKFLSPRSDFLYFIGGLSISAVLLLAFSFVILKREACNK